jgi:hypothetical protein
MLLTSWENKWGGEKGGVNLHFIRQVGFDFNFLFRDGLFNHKAVVDGDRGCLPDQVLQ